MLFNKDWNDLIFSEREKGFGAYYIRQKYKSTLAAIVFFVNLLFMIIGYLSFADILFGSDEQVETYRYVSFNSMQPLDSVYRNYPTPPAMKKIVIKKQETEYQIVDSVKNQITDTVKNENNQIIQGIDSLSKSKTPGDSLNTKGHSGGNGEVYFLVEDMPEFPGGVYAMNHFIVTHLQYPQEALQKNITGVVEITFCIDEFGSVKDISVTKPLYPLLDSAAVNVFRQMPKWKPGRQHNKNVRVLFTMPIIFGLQ